MPGSTILDDRTLVKTVPMNRFGIISRYQDHTGDNSEVLLSITESGRQKSVALNGI
jgi:hypothetical protein